MDAERVPEEVAVSVKILTDDVEPDNEATVGAMAIVAAWATPRLADGRLVLSERWRAIEQAAKELVAMYGFTDKAARDAAVDKLADAVRQSYPAPASTQEEEGK